MADEWRALKDRVQRLSPAQVEAFATYLGEEIPTMVFDEAIYTYDNRVDWMPVLHKHLIPYLMLIDSGALAISEDEDGNDSDTNSRLRSKSSTGSLKSGRSLARSSASSISSLASGYHTDDSIPKQPTKAGYGQSKVAKAMKQVSRLTTQAVQKIIPGQKRKAGVVSSDEDHAKKKVHKRKRKNSTDDDKQDNTSSSEEEKKRRKKGKQRESRSKKSKRKNESDEDEEQESVTKGAIEITTLTSVDRLIGLFEPPNYYPPPNKEESVAFMMDCTREDVDDPGSKRLCRYLRDADMDSWKVGTAGNKTKGPMVPAITEETTCRASNYRCQGALFCEAYDPAAPEANEEYVREDGSEKVWAEIERKERGRQESLLRDEVYQTALLLRLAQEPCKYKGCKGKPVIVTSMRSAGLTWFVGCDGWLADQQGNHKHRHLVPSRGENREMITKMMKGEVVPEADGRFETCYRAQSIRHRTEHCDQVHFRHGVFYVAKMMHRPCPTTRVSWEPHEMEPPIRKIIVLFKNPHNHPAFSLHKLTATDKRAVEKAYLDAGNPSISAKKLNIATSTLAANDGHALSEVHKGLVNNRLLSDALAAVRKNSHPLGFGWNGVVSAYEKDQLVDPQKRYHWGFYFSGPLHILVTMVPSLADCIHSATELVADFTFKRVAGEINEWEVAISKNGRRLTVARIYSDATDTEDYEALFSAFHKAVFASTGKHLQFRMIHGSGPIGYVLDADAAQALGLAKAIRQLPGVNNTQFPTDDDLLAHILVTCRVHFQRNLDNLRTVITPEDFRRLFDLVYIQTEAQFQTWRGFCSDHPEKRVRDWYENKEKFGGWLYPSICPARTKLSPALWTAIRHDTNIVEGQHATTNAETGIGLHLLNAIHKARKMDLATAQRLSDEDSLGLKTSNQNSDYNRLKKQVERKTTKNDKKTEARELQTQLKEVRGERGEIEQRLLENQSMEKQLKEEIKNAKKPTYKRNQPPLRPELYQPTQLEPVLPSPATHPIFEPENDPFQHPGGDFFQSNNDLLTGPDAPSIENLEAELWAGMASPSAIDWSTAVLDEFIPPTQGIPEGY